MKRAPLCILLLAFVPWAYAQQPAQPTPQKSISQSLGLHAFPAKDQTPAQQQKDEMACYNWAKQDTGFDPMGAPGAQQTAPPSTQPSKTPQTSGAGAKGAASGAAKGAVVGAVSGDAAKGAEVGAAAGAVGGRVKARRAERKSEEQAKQQQQQQQAQAKEQNQQKLESFKKGFSACMEAKGYVVK